MQCAVSEAGAADGDTESAHVVGNSTSDSKPSNGLLGPKPALTGGGERHGLRHWGAGS